MDQLDLKNAVLVGHSTGGGEVTRYIDAISAATERNVWPRRYSSRQSPRSYQTSFPLAVRQVLSAERLSNVASIANHGGIEHNRGVSVSDFAGAGRPGLATVKWSQQNKSRTATN